MRVGQALHGYRDGHRLLANSTPLPNRALDTMLAVTDAVDVHDEGRELFAMYGLPDTDYVAASLTWPALDVGRPGAVWSHTIFAEPTV